MRKISGWTGLRTSAVALVLAVGAVSGARAAEITSAKMEYDTKGSTIDLAKASTTVTLSDGITLTKGNIIQFHPVDQGLFDAPSSFSLGYFQVAALKDGETATFTNTPFQILFSDNLVNGVAPSAKRNETPITLSGTLNGTISGPDKSTLVATFDKATVGNEQKQISKDKNDLGPKPFRTGDFLDTLTVADPTLHLVPSSSNDGRTTAQAEMTVVYEPTGKPIPEPTSIALFLTALGGLGLRRRLRTGR